MIFRKVPRLFWSGGDVVYDNGFGCYAQRGRTSPIGAENYHFSHTMPGQNIFVVGAKLEMIINSKFIRKTVAILHVILHVVVA